MHDHLLTPGQLVAGRFLVTETLGRGGMGAVYKARHQTLPLDLAIKVLYPRLEQKTEFAERFRREAVAAALAKHPNVVAILDFGRIQDVGQYLVMEFLEGENLEQILDRKGRLTIQEALHVLIQLTDALDQAHRRGVVHRDLKLENILLCRERGRSDVVKLVDFGIAQILGEPAAKDLGDRVLGTPEYMSPEQAMGLPQDGRSDIYSVGILIYELLTGEPPFQGEPKMVLRHHVRTPPPLLSANAPGIPSFLDAIVLRCLAKKPQDRYPTAGHLRRDLLRLRAILAGAGSALVGPGPSRHPAFQTDAPWKPLGSVSEDAYVVLQETLEGPALEGVSKGMEAAQEGSELRVRYQHVLKDLTLGLQETGVATESMSETMREILELEEEQEALRAQKALLEQGYERVRFEMGEQESMLRYAILDLTTERDTLISAPGGPDTHRIDDLEFQIRKLKERLNEVVAERTARIQALNEEVSDYERRIAETDKSLSSSYIRLHTQIIHIQDRIRDTQFWSEYTLLEDIRRRLDEARRMATQSG